MADVLEREIARLSNLKQNKDKSPEELEPTARINIAVREFKGNPLFDIESENGKKEQKLAEERFHKYLYDNELESMSDLDTLRSLVFNEIFEQRIQTELNKLSSTGKYPPDKLIKSLVDVQNQKASLKVKLGIDKAEEEKDDLSALQLLEKRVQKHVNENKNEHTCWIPWTCKKCGEKDIESYLFYWKIKDFKAIKHPWYVGRFLFNYEIIKDVKDKKMTAEDATRYLMCAGQGGEYNPEEDKKYCTDYLKYCIENWTEITEMLNKK